ncbi:SIS domain-containing protein [Planctomonas sp. JC2975]|uniref:SIS domain-containing protein n=1 Tax=Planctomonas sp. JC2975 TaxID=2729626 RepID=UPI0014744C5E|nr:SIS domain-containing protein [Planctomonas sp. JC2975]NNC11717.1 SIS domain-containing protein [Planctomonas sp. JC2975]
MTDDMTRRPGADLEAELTSQPDVWERAAALASRDLLPPDGQRIAVIGCGTSWFMAQAYASLRERNGRGETDAFAASEAFVDRDYDAIVAITRSGTTTEVLELLDDVRGRARRDRARTIGVVGDPNTPLVELVDDVIALAFADEHSVVQTRFATSALALLRASVGQDLSRAIAQARDVLAADLDDELIDAEQYTFLGTGWTVGIAHEAALKMRESSQSWTESYPAKEYRHGPIAIAAPGRVTWAFGEPPTGIAEDTAAAGARFEHNPIDAMADLVRLHRVALERARRKGLDPDQPRNLTRSVILDRP